jgi:hypothetical protein
LFLIPVVALAESGDEGSGTIYYVANDGNDGNSGTSPDDAWQTIDKINSELFSPGDSILFKRNDHWRGHLIPQSGSTDGYVTYGAYGTGNKPLLLGSTEKNDLNDWIYEGNDIWATTKLETLGEELFANPSFDKNADNWYLWCEGNANAYGSRDSSDYDSSPASYRIDCTSQTSEIYDIQFSSRVANISSGKVYKLEFRARCTKPFTMDYIALMKDGSPWNCYYSNPINSPNITTEWTTHAVCYKADASATDAKITFFLGGILPEDETFHIDSISFKECENENSYCDIGNIIFDNEKTCGVKKWYEEDLDKQGEFWYDKENSVIKIYSIDNPASYYSDIECALTTTIIDESNKSYVIYENLELKYGGAHGIGGGNTHHIIVRDCDLSYIGGGEFPFPMEGYDHVRFGGGIEFWGNAHDNLVERCRIWEIYDTALTNQNNEPNKNQYNISYQNNIIWNCEWSYEFWNLDETSFMYDISFVNNTCAYAGGGWGHSQRPDPWGLHVLNFANITDTGQIRIINNIFYESTENCIYISSAYDGLENLNLDHNCWYQASGNMMNFQGYRYTMSQFSMYQSEKLQDQNSIAEAPLFTNPSETDFHPQENSPVIDHGFSFDVPEDDFDRNCRHEGIDHDMGAYEFVFNVPPVNIPPTADAGQDQTVFEGDTVTLDGSASMDPDDGIAFIRWIQTSGTPVALSDPAALQPKFIAPEVGGEGETLIFQLTVTDMAGLASQDTCVVIVNPTAQILPPTADIKANGLDGTVTVRRYSSVSISISIDPGDLKGETADLWLVAEAPWGRFFYVYGSGWQVNSTPFIQYPLDELISYKTFNVSLPKGDYFFHFAIDDNADGILDGTWLDTVLVQVR